MQPFKITLCRTTNSFVEVEILAETLEDAEAITLDKARDYTYSEQHVEYSIS